MGSGRSTGGGLNVPGGGIGSLAQGLSPGMGGRFPMGGAAAPGGQFGAPMGQPAPQLGGQMAVPAPPGMMPGAQFGAPQMPAAAPGGVPPIPGGFTQDQWANQQSQSYQSLMGNPNLPPQMKAQAQLDYTRQFGSSPAGMTPSPQAIQAFRQNASKQGINTAGPQLGQGMPAQSVPGVPMSQSAARSGIMGMIGGFR